MDKYTLFFCTALLLLGLAQANAGQMYKWVDKSGKVTYHDRPPPSGSDVQAERRKYRSELTLDQEQEYAREEASGKFPVILYVITKCDVCELARNYLKQHKIPFTEKNVETNVKNNVELVSKGGSKTVPTIRIGEKFIIGYQQGQIEQGLIEAGYISTNAGDEDSDTNASDEDNDEPQP